MTTPSLDDLLASLPDEAAGDGMMSPDIEEGWEEEPEPVEDAAGPPSAPAKSRRRGFALTPRRAFGLLAIVLTLILAGLEPFQAGTLAVP